MSGHSVASRSQFEKRVIPNNKFGIVDVYFDRGITNRFVGFL